MKTRKKSLFLYIYINGHLIRQSVGVKDEESQVEKVWSFFFLLLLLSLIFFFKYLFLGMIGEVDKSFSEEFHLVSRGNRMVSQLGITQNDFLIHTVSLGGGGETAV